MTRGNEAGGNRLLIVLLHLRGEEGVHELRNPLTRGRDPAVREERTAIRVEESTRLLQRALSRLPSRET